MPGTAELERVYSAIEETARIVGAPCSRDNVWPYLSAFGGSIEDALMVFSLQTGERHAGELDYSFTASPGIGDPYLHALSHGFVTETDHPIGSLVSDLQGRWAIREHFVDCGVAGGFKKLYVHFPGDLQPVAKLAEIPSVAPAVAENADLFARTGLHEVAMVGVDYKRKTMNLYFQFTPDGVPEPSAYRSLLREVGLHEPNDDMLKFVSGSMRCNVTLSWDSSTIVRVAVARPPGRRVDPAEVPAPIEPHIARFATSAPYAYPGELMNLFGVKWFPDGEFIDVSTYYQISAGHVGIKLMETFKDRT
ncbi:hypothetical protein DMB38_25245 [Streptomyces sp. WAC 06738]|uniref:aromatic prenyltransferase n=1 Tax=Streptomyces sp. WAC 06738 TaxID=2203210 RepID=UPI000F6E59EB|nr:aromatic prenyltransferase [Streptomyces sp. WAC 06738]AZM48655.1 hypothetical protein DMB38_25245 [Streptomyces sp. WAC 06738]